MCLLAIIGLLEDCRRHVINGSGYVPEEFYLNCKYQMFVFKIQNFILRILLATITLKTLEGRSSGRIHP